LEPVKCSVRFRGREITHANVGQKILERVKTEVADLCTLGLVVMFLDVGTEPYLFDVNDLLVFTGFLFFLLYALFVSVVAKLPMLMWVKKFSNV
jgi:hypothetical protein